jgi:hypothetical protein
MRFIAALLVALPLTAAATKPCPADPCAPHGGELDPEICAQKASYILVGTVESLTHNKNPAPVFKDFIEFVVRVDKWERGKGPATLRFKVGWCNNSRPPPAEIGAKIRIYGEGEPVTTDERGPQYIGLVPLKPAAK